MTGILLTAFVPAIIYHLGVPPEDRIYPWHFIKQMELNILQYHLFTVAGVMFMVLYYVLLLFRFTSLDDSLIAGVRVLPFICMVVFLGFLNGALMPKYGYYMPRYIVGDVIILVGLILMGRKCLPHSRRKFDSRLS